VSTDPALPVPVQVGLLQLFLACSKIGMTSFGGSVSAMMRVEFVTVRRWVTDAEFLSGLALAQVLPGVNVTNLSIWLGYRLRGSAGAVAACLGSIVPAALLIILGGAAIASVSRWPMVGVVLAGVAAAALGMSLHMGLLASRHALVDATSVVVLVATFIGVVLHVPLVLIVVCLAPISVTLAYLKIRREA
jgi:chromate transporter